MSSQEYIKKLEALERLVENQAKVIAHQAKVIAALEARLNENSGNSHRPPSSDGPKARAQRRKTRPKRKSSKRKQGAQPGHKGKNRRLIATEDVDHLHALVPSNCHHCQAKLQGVDAEPQRHQVTDIPPIKPVVTEYQLHKLTCPDCGVQTRAKLPHGVTWSHFGPNVSALAVTLRADSRLSITRVQALLKTVFGFSLSRGAISAIDARASELLAPVHEELQREVAKADVVHMDETTWYHKGKRHMLWLALSKLAAYMKLEPSRSQQAAQKVIGEDYQGVLVTDRYCAYHWVDAKRRQMCWAHLIRDFDGMGLQKGQVGYCGQMLAEQARRLLKGWAQARDGTRPWDEYVVWGRKQRLFFEGVLMGVRREGKGTKWGGMANEMLRHFESLWTFLEVKGVEPTNNAAERALRHPVVARKLSFGSQSERGLRFIERVLSLRETLRLQSKCFFSYLQALFRAQPTPLLTTS